MAKIFISYRREFDDFVVLNVSGKLRAHFGNDSVFLDTDNIPIGVDFREHLDNEVGQCDILLAIISKQWVNAANDQGGRRLEDPGDFVLIEIESAINRKIPVVPVLVNDTPMPSAKDLPESIRKLVYLQATILRSGLDFDHHIERLIRGLENLFKTKEEPKTPELVTPEPPKFEEPKKEPDQKSEKKIKAPDNKKTVDDNKALKDTNKKDKRAKVLEIIKSGLGDYSDTFTSVGKAIPFSKLAGAIAAYAPKVDRKDVLLLHDDTFFGGAQRGLLLTIDSVYYCDWTSANHFPYKKIKSIELLKIAKGANKLLINGKEIQMTAYDTAKKNAIFAEIIRRLTKL